MTGMLNAAYGSSTRTCPTLRVGGFLTLGPIRFPALGSGKLAEAEGESEVGETVATEHPPPTGAPPLPPVKDTAIIVALVKGWHEVSGSRVEKERVRSGVFKLPQQNLYGHLLGCLSRIGEL